MRFVNRQYELKELERIWNLSAGSTHFTVISGRRRVGKTELVKRFCRNKKHMYFFVGRKNLPLLLEELTGIARASIDPFPGISRFDEWLEFLLRSTKKGTIIFFDEFQNFKYIDKSIFSDFQKVLDKYKNTSNIHLIAAGSHTILMSKIFSDDKEPLFGRATETYTLKPLLFKDISKMLAEIKITGIEEQINWYIVFGGMPKYYVIAQEQGLENTGIFNALETLLLRDFAPLKEEAHSILVEEFGREHPSYFSILEAVALGNSEMTTIANKSGINIKSISKYLSLLVRDFRYLDYRIPITEEKPWKSKKGRYFLADNFFRFWFRYIYRNKSDYEIGNYDAVMTKIRRDFATFSGEVFEEISKEFLIVKNSENHLQFDFTKIGRWWHKDKEIDIVALNIDTKEILFCECKYKYNVNPQKILKELKEKAQYVQWNNGARKEYFAIFAKSFKEKIKEPDVMLFDLDDISKLCC